MEMNFTHLYLVCGCFVGLLEFCWDLGGFAGCETEAVDCLMLIEEDLLELK